MRLEGKRAIITGGGRGIGRAYVERFLREGAEVVIGDIDVKNAEDTSRELSALGRVAFVRVDVADEVSVAAFIDEAAIIMGGIDIVLNNAGLLADWDKSDESLANLKRVFDVNLHSAWLVTRAAAPHLIASGAGRVINQASTAAYAYRYAGPTEEFAGLSTFSYSQSKRAVVGLTKYAAAQLGNWGVTVNAIAPGMTHTGGIADLTDAQKATLMAQQPIKGAIRPADLTGAAVYFASDEAHFVTGQTLVIDGGRFMPA